MSELEISCLKLRLGITKLRLSILKLRLAIERGSSVVSRAASPKKDEARMYVALKLAAIRKSKKSADLVSRAQKVQILSHNRSKFKP